MLGSELYTQPAQSFGGPFPRAAWGLACSCLLRPLLGFEVMNLGPTPHGQISLATPAYTLSSEQRRPCACRATRQNTGPPVKGTFQRQMFLQKLTSSLCCPASLRGAGESRERISLRRAGIPSIDPGEGSQEWSRLLCLPAAHFSRRGRGNLCQACGLAFLLERGFLSKRELGKGLLQEATSHSDHGTTPAANGSQSTAGGNETVCIGIYYGPCTN
nr:uncharacterized protein LOC123279061 [Equus asinus]